MKLNPLPNEYKTFYDEIMSDEWLLKKIDREYRLKQEKKYIDKYLPEIKKGKLRILDIGAGPGEFSEIAMDYKCSCFDIIAPPGQKPYYYEEYCRLNHIRQRIPFVQLDFYNQLKNGSYISNQKFDIINCKHAINLLFYKHMIVGEKPSDMSWKFDDEFKKIWRKFISFIENNCSGIIMISALHSQNNKEYSDFIVSTMRNYKLLINEKDMIHKFIRL